MIKSDPCSLSNIDSFQVTHLDWSIQVDFELQKLSCLAVQRFICLKDECTKLVLDTSQLNIETVLYNEDAVPFNVLPCIAPFGEPLEITIPSTKIGSEFTITIKYHTSSTASALQWLKPEQTLDKKYPYMFTQCQAIHARSLVPCQDSPCHKFTYSSKVIVPAELVALMSAVKGGEVILENNMKECSFQQKICVPSYLLAIAVGPLEFRDVGPRSKVWCEASMIDLCAFEFGKVEDMLKAGESLMGPYVWEQYDILVLPPSFPYGGMENPCLTFVTPTVVVGDRSLTSVIAHEITHSWTGNLVTNKTWEHFWLNEGFTRFLEGKIIGHLDGKLTQDFMAIDGWSHLHDSIEVFGKDNKLTALQPDLNGVDPDDSFSSVPYEKGYAFLYYIEHLVGGPDVFNVFLRQYIEKFKYKSIVTKDFKEFLCAYFMEKVNLSSEIDWDAWLYSPGMPPVQVIDMYDHTLATYSKKLADKWIMVSCNGDFSCFSEEDFKSFTVLQKIDFLTKLYQTSSLSLPAVIALSNIYKLSSYKNTEIKFAFLRLCVRSKWSERYDDVVNFLVQQGRMKFVRPLYREMFKNDEAKDLAIKTFQKHRHVYHSITSTMISKDLHLGS
ncbi:leukotriene A-4 hydrolase isoform X1 [Hydra vulgaris]|uniref:leukotriene A-4 hydrolase isoform X1 n=1 Tax=Hydra vulgaris TaxID=6087 RepID=UPI001F5FDEC1|nr:leukotriene A-4 hydrolase [Hydra vulgaris]